MKSIAIISVLSFLMLGCATTSEPTLEGLMRASYFVGCSKEATSMALTDQETEYAIDKCTAKMSTWDPYDVGSYDENLMVVRRNIPKIHQRR